MAILDFPDTRPGGSPLQAGDTYTGDNGVTYIWDGVKWIGRGAVGYTGIPGPQGETGAAGAPGANGAKGDPGNTGPRGPKGDQGLQGNASTVAGPKGDTGDQGVSVQLQGTKATLAELQVITGNPGDGWIVTDQDGSLYFWDIALQQWDNIGKIVGPQGDPGP